jgi:hypothetical protein
MELALAIRQILYRMSKMGWPDKFKENYIRQEYAPDLHLMQLSMFADRYIEDIETKKVGLNGKETG